MDTDLGDSDASFWGEDTWDHAGKAVASAGDVNGDGLDDILIGASGDDDGGDFAGQTYLVLGRRKGWSMDTDLSGADSSYWGEEEDDYSGSAVAGAGDVNGDGYDDFLIGARGNDDAGWGAGKTYLFLGMPDMWPMDTDVSRAYATYRGEHAGDSSGGSVAGVGDVNGDGYDDFLIGASGSDRGGEGTGQAYLVFGKRAGWEVRNNLRYVDASFHGYYPGSSSVTEVAGAGDVNGDGYDDILVAGMWNSEGGKGAGQTYLVLGKAEGWSMRTNLSEADASFYGERADDGAGYSIAGAGDVNGDGYDDILIGSHRSADAGVIAGQTYLVLGKPSGWSRGTSLSEADASFWGEHDGDFSGCSVAGAGDVNGDGYDDILIGATDNDANGPFSGQTYLILGKASGWHMDTLLANSDTSFWGEEGGDGCGISVAGAGDVNGDGLDDILIGADGNSDGGDDAGQVYLIMLQKEEDAPSTEDGWPWEEALLTIAVAALVVAAYHRFGRRR